MWGYAIFCEFPGCSKFEAVTVEGEVPFGWLSAEQGAEHPEFAPDNLGTFCGWPHMLAGLQQLAPDDALDVRSTSVRRELPIDASGRSRQTAAGPT